MVQRVSGTQSSTRPAAPPAPSATVTVQPGETLGHLAARAGVSVAALVQANADRYPQLATRPQALQSGWRLRLPDASTTAPTSGWHPTGTTGARRAAVANESRQAFGARLAAGGAQSIELRTQRHLDSIERTGVGTYFGDHSSWKTMSSEEREQWLTDHLTAGAARPEAASIKESSCIGWAMENVGAAYAAAGKADRWAQIRRTVVANGSKGTELAKALKADGWQALYWNPDTRKPSDGDPEHTVTAARVARGGAYYGVAVDGQVTNYRPSDGTTTRDATGLELLKEVPFFFGLARGGSHTFVGRDGKVSEFHWAEMPDSRRAIEETPLEQFGWNSGLIMVPPGSWVAAANRRSAEASGAGEARRAQAQVSPTTSAP